MPIFKSVFDSPLTYTPDLKLAPNVIRAWKISGETAPPSTLTFRDDVVFHNGDRLTAEDFRFSFFERQHADPKLPTAGIWRKISDIEVQSPTKAVVKFSAPMPTAPQWWAFLGSFILPKKYFESVGHDGFLDKPVGSGPYQRGRISAGRADRARGASSDIGAARPGSSASPSRWSRIRPRASPRWNPGKPTSPSRSRCARRLRLGKTPGLDGRVDPITDLVMMQSRQHRRLHRRQCPARRASCDRQAGDLEGFLQRRRQADFGAGACRARRATFQASLSPTAPSKAKELLAKSGYGPRSRRRSNSTRRTAPSPTISTWRAPSSRCGRKSASRPISTSSSSTNITSSTIPARCRRRRSMRLGQRYRRSRDLCRLSSSIPKLPFSTWKSDDVGEILDKLFAETELRTSASPAITISTKWWSKRAMPCRCCRASPPSPIAAT